MVNDQQLQAVIMRLLGYVERADYRGYDPYDALSSPFVRVLTGGLKYGRIAWTQFLRRSPVNLRPLLGIRKGLNPKGLGLFLGSYAKLYRLDPQPNGLERIKQLTAALRELRSTAYPGHGWGYNFPWQSRAAFVPAGTPTIVNTAFVGHALLDAGEATGWETATELALPAGDFLLRGVNRLAEGDTCCLSYTPIDRNFVHNANLLAASLLIRLADKTGRNDLREAAMASLAYSMRHQHADGAWYYAEAGIQHWIDSFHTGFNLQAIRGFLRAGHGEQYRVAYERGVRYYAERFFLEDGTPKYYERATYPIDIHAPAQALAFFAEEGPAYEPLVARVLDWLLANLYDERRGTFYFRRGRRSVNRIPYMRWGQAWALHGLTACWQQRARPATERG